jgi:hypothetical protein
VALIQPFSRIKPLRPSREHDGEDWRYRQLTSLYPRSLTTKARVQVLDYLADQLGQLVDQLAVDW